MLIFASLFLKGMYMDAERFKQLKVYVEKDLLINDNTENDPRERKANEYAAEILIPRSWDSTICSITSKRAVIQIARQLGISPGVVGGRYQHLTKKWHFFNELKQKLQWAEN